jgi:hypothetical protein
MPSFSDLSNYPPGVSGMEPQITGVDGFEEAFYEYVAGYIGDEYVEAAMAYYDAYYSQSDADSDVESLSEDFEIRYCGEFDTAEKMLIQEWRYGVPNEVHPYVNWTAMWLDGAAKYYRVLGPTAAGMWFFFRPSVYDEAESYHG